MTNYVRKLLNAAEAEGLKFEIDGGGDEFDYVGYHPAQAEEAIVAVDEASVYLRDRDGKQVGWALIVNGLEDDERIADCDAEGFVNRWSEGVLHS